MNFSACFLIGDGGSALASQSLSIMFELIPYVRETFRRHLSPKQAVMLVEFDKLKRVCLFASPVSKSIYDGSYNHLGLSRTSK